MSCLDWSVGGGVTLVTSLVIAVVAGLVVLPHRLLHHHHLHPVLTISDKLDLSHKVLSKCFIRNCQYFPSGRISFPWADLLGSRHTVFPAEGGPAERKDYPRHVRDDHRGDRRDPRDDRRDDQPRWR